MIGKLLGHTQVQTTAVKASAARIGDVIDNDLDAVQQTSSGHSDSPM